MALTLTGFVFDNAGNAIPGATVQGYVSADDQTSGTTAGDPVLTDANGKWAITTSTASQIPMDVRITYGSSKRWIKAGDKLNVTDLTVTGALTVGEDGTGFDVTLFGDTPSRSAVWDQSEDALQLNDNTELKFGSVLAGDMVLYHDGSDSYIKNATGALKLATESTGIAVTIGHTTSEVTIGQNLTVTGTLTLGSGAELSEAELEFIDGITAGTAAANKAVVLDGSKNIATIGTIGSGAITSTGTSSFATAIRTPLIEFTDGDDAITIADGGGITAAAGITSTAAANTFGTTSYGSAGSGVDVTFYSATSGDQMLWDTSAKKLVITGTDGTNALEVADGNVAITDNLTVSGDLTVSGTTTTVDTTNTVVTDNLLELNSGVSSNTNDSGIIIERGSTGNNAILMWDESADVFTVGTTTATADSTGNLANFAAAPFTAAAIVGTTIDAATDFTIGATVITNGVITDASGLSIAAAVDLGSNTLGTSGVITAGGFTIGSAAILEAELEILDGASVSTDELNLLDGDTSVGGSITLADTDGFVVNDGGTMKTIPASDINTYVGDSDTTYTAGVGLGLSGTTLSLDLSELSTVTPADGDFFSTLDSDGANEQKTTTTALATLFAGTGLTASSSVIGVDASLGHVTTVGALEAGSITSDFGNIDIGASTFDTTGAVSTGALTLSGALISSTDGTLDIGTDAAPFQTAYIQSLQIEQLSGHASLTMNAESADTDPYIIFQTESTSKWSWAYDSSSDFFGLYNYTTSAYPLAFVDASNNVYMQATGKLLLDYGAGSNYLHEASSNVVEIVSGGSAVQFSTGDVTLAADKDLKLSEGGNVKFTDPVQDNGVDDHASQGVVFTFKAGMTVTPFSPVYLHTDNEVHECDADAIAKMPCIGVSLNTSNVTDGNDIEVMMLGIIRDDDFAFGTAGAPVYVSTTVGEMTNTAPSGTDDVVQIVGHSIADDAIFVQPCLTTIEHA